MEYVSGWNGTSYIKIGGCWKPSTYQFWKHPADAANRVSTRRQLKQRRFVPQSYVAEYYDLLKTKISQ